MLKIEDIQAGYGELPVLRGISLEIGRNESVAIIGPNGAGKTTLVRAICGLLPVRAGRIEKDGQDITRLPSHQRAARGIAVVLEGRHLFGELSVRSNLELAAAHGRPAPFGQDATAGQDGDGRTAFGLDNVLDLFPFMRERLEAAVELLSGGEQQMVAIARALLLRPDLLIMDEPSTGLAPKVVKDIVSVVGQLRRRGMSILLVEQNVAIAAETTDRAYVLSLGRVAHEIPQGSWDAFLRDESLVKAYLEG